MDYCRSVVPRVKVESMGARRRFFRIPLRIAAILGALYFVALGALAYEMRQTPEHFSRVMQHVGATAPFLLFPFETLWKSARSGHVNVGDLAPDFTLPILDVGRQVTLSSFRGKQPVVVVFGSYT